MAPLMRERSQNAPRPANMKLLVTLFGAACLSVILFLATPTHAAPATAVLDQAKQATGGKISGGGCTGGDLKPCIHANTKKGLVVTEVFVKKSTSKPAEVPTCPTSVTLKLFDNNGLVTSSLVGSGCGHFSGPTTAIQQGDTFTVQVQACFSDKEGDCAAVPSPDLVVS